MTFEDMVKQLFKDPSEIQATLDPVKVNLMHAVFGISGEAGELLDGVKKAIIYNKELDVENVIEELGDIEFYMEALRQGLGITREQTLEANIEKLGKRYQNHQYTDQQAHDRNDKIERDFIGMPPKQEHDAVMRGIGLPTEGDGQEHSDIMRELGHG